MARKDAKIKGDIIDRSKYGYTRTKTTGADGKVRSSTSNGDAVAKALMLIPTGDAAISKVAKDNDLYDRIKDRLGSANAGQIRMSVGNMLRAKVRKGEPVTIGEIVVKKLDQTVKVPDAPKPAPAKKDAKPEPKAKKVGGKRKPKAEAQPAA